MRKVLLATDGSSSANHAAEFLARLPRRQPMELVVATILEDPSIAHSAEMTSYLQAAVEQERKAAEETFVRIQELFEGADVVLRSVIQIGHRGDTLVQLAKEENADLVVVGALGHSVVGRMLLGSTSDYVATHAPCSVLVVRPTQLAESGQGLKIAIGFDGSEPAHAAMKEVKEICWGTGPEVHLVTVVSYLSGFLNEVIPDTEAIRKVALEAVQNAAQELLPVAPNTRADVIVSDHVGEGLVRFVEENQCDLAIIGESHRTEIGRFLLGSFSRFVLRHSPSSVWISRY